MHLGNLGVDQRFQAVPLALDNELALATQVRSRQQDEFYESQNAVFFDNLGSGNGLFDLLGDHLWIIEQVDLTVCMSRLASVDIAGELAVRTLVAGAHLAAMQSGNHGVQNMGALHRQSRTQSCV